MNVAAALAVIFASTIEGGLIPNLSAGQELVSSRVPYECSALRSTSIQDIFPVSRYPDIEGIGSVADRLHEIAQSGICIFIGIGERSVPDHFVGHESLGDSVQNCATVHVPWSDRYIKSDVLQNRGAAPEVFVLKGNFPSAISRIELNTLRIDISDFEIEKGFFSDLGRPGSFFRGISGGVRSLLSFDGGLSSEQSGGASSEQCEEAYDDASNGCPGLPTRIARLIYRGIRRNGPTGEIWFFGTFATILSLCALRASYGFVYNKRGWAWYLLPGVLFPAAMIFVMTFSRAA